MNVAKFILFLTSTLLFFSCNKEKVDSKGLDPTIETVTGVWSFQYSEEYLTDNNGKVIRGVEILLPEQLNTMVYTFNSDLTYNMASMLTDGSEYVYNTQGTYKIMESSLEAKMEPHFNFDNHPQINNIIRYLDSDRMEIYNFGGGFSSIYSHNTSHYLRIK